MKQNFMYKLLFLVTLMLWGFGKVEAQIEFKLQLLVDDTSKWGVYARLSSGSPSTSQITASGQATIVAPNGFALSSVTSVNGVWSANARVNAPPENPDYDYISVGWQSDGTSPIVLATTSELLLFTFPKNQPCPDTLYLINNTTDPFNVLPNSYGTNPGNDLIVSDIDISEIYYYSNNYALSAWSCHDCDSDGLLNAQEDTNGDGTYSVGDTTDMCDPCDPIHPLIAEMSGDTIMCSVEDEVYIYVNITNAHPVYGWEPYIIEYTDGTDTTTVNNYFSGDPITVSPTATDTFTIVSVTDSRGCTPDTIRGSAIITVEGPIAISVDPTDVVECSGNSASFTATATNGGTGTIRYNWQVRDFGSGTYADLDNGTPYTGVFSNTLQISNVAGLHNKEYRVKIYTTTCDSVFSDWALLEVEGPISINLNPVSQTICSGSPVTFTGGATNSGAAGTLNLRWQISTDNGSTYTDITDGGVYSGATTGILDISDVDGLHDERFRLKAWTGECDTVFSTAAVLTVEGPYTITTQPVDSIAECSGQSVFVAVGVTNSGAGNIQYQWQVSSNDGGSWTNLINNDTWNGVRTDTLSIDLSDTIDGLWVRVQVWTATCATVTSDYTVLSISDQATYDLQPVDINICDGLDTFFAASATVAQGTFTYQWQVSKDNGQNWTDIADGADTEGVTYGGATNDTLSLTTVSYLMNGFKYRVQAVTGDCDPAASAEATLRVEGPLSIEDDIDDITVCFNEQAFFNVDSLSNPGFGTVSYQWQVKPAGLTTWFPINSNSATYGGVGTRRLTIAPVGLVDSNMYRVIISTPNCASIMSDSALLVVEGPLGFSDHPDDFVVCSGGSASFTAVDTNATNSGTVVYQWQVSTDTINYSNISDGGPFGYSGTNTSTLNIADVTGAGVRRYRLRISTGACNFVYSNHAQLIVEGPISIDPANQPEDVTICAENSAVFFTQVTNPGQGTVRYQWQLKPASGGPWSDLRNSPDHYNGVTTDSLAITDPTPAMNGDSVRVMVWTGTCAVTTSAAAALYVEGPIIITNEPDNDTICSGGATSFTVAYTNPGAGTPTIHWEYSTDNGSSWDTVLNSAPYSGVGGLTLSVSAADSTYNGYLYRAVFTLTTCESYYSDEAKLVVQGPIRFRGMPQDVTTCAGEHAYFELFPSPTNGGAGTVLYQWQVLPPMASNWVSLANDTLYSGTSSVRLTIVNVAGLGGTQYRAIIRTGECARDTSDAATLFVEGSMTFDREPEDATVCSGGDTIFVAAVTNGGVGNLNYQWQRSLDGVTGWTNISDGAVYSGTTNDTLTVLNTTGLNGVWYRMISYVGTCTPIATRRARLTVEGPITVTAQPQSVTDCNANSVFFRILANAPVGTIQYRWERRRSPSDPWIPTVNDTTIVGSQTDSIALLDIVADSFNGNQFRVRYWTNVCNSAYSNIATITIEGPVTITDMPDDTTVCSGQPAFFEITANNGTGGALTYVWQVSTNGVVWSNVPNSAPYSGIATSRLDISNVAGLGGRRYRCMVFTGACDPVYSDPARLTVNGPVTFEQPTDQLNVCANAEANFTTTVANLGSGVMSFTWQVSEGDSLNWMDVTEPLMSGNYYDGENTTTLFINQVADSVNAVYFNGNYYRLRVSLATCDDFFSRAALLEVVTDTLGHCDFDLDGDINDIDEDDDDDGVPDDWEYGCLGLHNYDVDADNNGTIDGEEDNDGDQFNNREELDEDGVFDGDPCDPCSPIISINCFGISLRLKTMLYGASLSRDPLNPNGLRLDTMMMKDDLRTKGLIPLTDPYASKSGFTHAGDTSLRADEYIADSLAVLGVEGDDAIVDWVFIELRSANELDSVIATKSALLQRDGDVVRTDGVSPVTFDTSTLAGPYYVVIRHRNHLGVMTIDAPELSPQMRNIDMRDTTFKFHGKHSMYRGTYNFSTRQYNKKSKYSYQWAGDLTHDGKAVYQGPGNDGTQILLDVLAAQQPLYQANPNYEINANYIYEGYLDTDFDLNGQAIYQGPLNDRSMILVNSILLHPGNEHRLANFIMLEQLP